MRSAEKTAKTVREALDLALAELGIGLEDAEYEILEMPKSGIWGLGSKEARVRVTTEENAARVAIAFLEPVLAKLGAKATCAVEEKEDFLWISYVGENMGRVIGRRGETLNALQYLVNLAVGKNLTKKPRIILDVEGYRQSRTETLAALAKKVANKVKRTGRDVMLEPMSPYERRIIHMTLQEDAFVQTLSQGEEPARRVVITKKRY